MPLAALPFPHIDPVLIEFGPLVVRWYALAYIGGLLFAWWYSRRLVQSPGLWAGEPAATRYQVDDIIVWIALGVVLGGRLGYVLFYNPAYFAAHPVEIFVLWRGGMSFHGGCLGVILACVLYAWRQRISMLSMLDLSGASVPVGLGLGRLANFINGELYGRVSDLPWAVVFPAGGPEPRHPSQIYEALLEGLVLFLALRLLTHRYRSLRRPGLTGAAFLAGYGLFRIVAEVFRAPDAHIGFLPGGLTMGMALSLPMIVIGLGAIVLIRRAAHGRA